MTLPLLAAASLLLAAAVVPSAAEPLAAERWNKRVVLVFASNVEGDAKRQIDGFLADRDALAERDMLLLAVSGETVSAPFGAMAGNARIPDARALREAFRIPPETPFTVVLVGKDGGEKLRRTEPVAAKDIFDLVDSMPMRRSEAGG